jgi:hypothetical protein
MEKGDWPKKIEQGAEQGLLRLVEPLIALIRHEDEPPERPYVFKIVDEQGNEREVVAPRGRFTRWLW